VLTKWTRKSFGPKEHARLHHRLCQANIFRKTLGFSYAFLMLTGLASFSVRFLRFEVTLAWAKEAEMLAVTFIVSCLSVCGFYVYVLVQLRREEKRGDAHKKHLPEHLYEIEPEPRQDDSENPTGSRFFKFRNSQSVRFQGRGNLASRGNGSRRSQLGGLAAYNNGKARSRIFLRHGLDLQVLTPGAKRIASFANSRNEANRRLGEGERWLR
jgi:hypothetical protein